MRYMSQAAKMYTNVQILSEQTYTNVIFRNTNVTTNGITFVNLQECQCVFRSYIILKSRKRVLWVDM